MLAGPVLGVNPQYTGAHEGGSPADPGFWTSRRVADGLNSTTGEFIPGADGITLSSVQRLREDWGRSSPGKNGLESSLCQYTGGFIPAVSLDFNLAVFDRSARATTFLDGLCE